MPRLVSFAAGLLACAASAANAQRTSDVLPAWPISHNRSAAQQRGVVAHGPSGSRAAPVVAASPADEAPSQPLPLPAEAQRAKPLEAPPIAPALSREMIDAAVDQATFQSVPRLTIPEPKLPSTTASPSDSDLVTSSGANDGGASREAPPATPVEARDAQLHAASKPGEPRRLLAPRSSGPSLEGGATASPLSAFGNGGLDSEALATAGASLAIVVGLLLMLTWLWRRAAPKSSRPLPEEVATVLGRVPLGGKQMAQMLKVGGKLVLVAVTPDGVKPITEVTDPEEVTRLLGLCEQAGAHSATAEFREVFEQIVREPATPGFLGDESSLIDRQKLADAYAYTPGGRAYG